MIETIEQIKTKEGFQRISDRKSHCEKRCCIHHHCCDAGCQQYGRKVIDTAQQQRCQRNATRRPEDRGTAAHRAKYQTYLGRNKVGNYKKY